MTGTNVLTRAEPIAHVIAEPSPTPKPHWWRPLWIVVYRGEERAKYCSRGVAEKHARILNAGHAVPDLTDSTSERWAWAS